MDPPPPAPPSCPGWGLSGADLAELWDRLVEPTSHSLGSREGGACFWREPLSWAPEPRLLSSGTSKPSALSLQAGNQDAHFMDGNGEAQQLPRPGRPLLPAHVCRPPAGERLVKQPQAGTGVPSPWRDRVRAHRLRWAVGGQDHPSGGGRGLGSAWAVRGQGHELAQTLSLTAGLGTVPACLPDSASPGLLCTLPTQAGTWRPFGEAGQGGSGWAGGDRVQEVAGGPWRQGLSTCPAG